jgi:hypothetical protein
MGQFLPFERGRPAFGTAFGDGVTEKVTHILQLERLGERLGPGISKSEEEQAIIGGRGVCKSHTEEGPPEKYGARVRSLFNLREASACLRSSCWWRHRGKVAYIMQLERLGPDFSRLEE